MSSDIKIIEKPERVSWEEIHQVLWKSHEENRRKGVVMGLPSKSPEELHAFIEEKGKIFVALDGERVVGTLAYIIKEGRSWYNHGRYCYACLGSVLPEFSGRGLFRMLDKKVEDEACVYHLPIIISDTHENNVRMLKISKKEGYQFVSYKVCKDHFNIVRAKWLDGCPYPSWYIKMRFNLSKFKLKTRYKMVPGKGRVKRFGI